MPVNVLDLSRHLFALGGMLNTRASRPGTTFDGAKGGKPTSHRQVAFVSPCPYSHG
jgi:hypothetical protein